MTILSGKGKKFVGFILTVLVSCSTPVAPPEPVQPVPTQQQVAWQEMEFYGFLHFNMNTFTNQEWGYGDKSPELFNPTALDARQWAKVAKEAGMKGLIITAKHHDGFCLWPSEYTEYSVKNSVWRDGKGDVLKDLAEACKEYGLKMGVYLSPWDRNHKDYGKPEYITYFRNQLRELLTNYGDIFEVWFDGANGGDGYYGGAKEERRVDKRSYYDWDNTIKIIRELQPNAVIFSDGGPDVRWVGNEHGYAYPTTWSPLLRDEVYGGMPEYSKQYSPGQENGTHWVPAEADVSIRPGWYYHQSEDNKVRSLNELLEIYYKSIGQNSNFLLNFPVDRRGLVHENDVKQLEKLTKQLKLDFAEDLALNKAASATNVRGDAYAASNVNDGNKDTYWATGDGQITASITLDLKDPTEINRFLVQEYIPFGQRVKAFSLEAEVDGNWKTIDNQTTIGYKRIMRFDKVVATKVRLNIIDAKACPVISNISLYNAPVIVDVPVVNRDKSGMVSLNTPEEGVEVYYTLDGDKPTLQSMKYTNAFEVSQPATIKAFAYDPITKRQSELVAKDLDISKKHWKILNASDESVKAIDDNPNSNWTLEKGMGNIQVVLDLGKEETLTGFSYTPTQSRWVSGLITHYRFYTSKDNKKWALASKGEFSNIVNNPLEQQIDFNKSVRGRYIKLVVDKLMDDSNKAVIAEIGITTK